MLPVAIDAMGGDNAPDDVVAGAKLAHERGIPVVLVGNPKKLDAGDLEVIPAMEIIPMDASPSTAVRTIKDSSLGRAAESVRDKRASALVSAGNTGAVMAAALIKIGRIRGVARPAIAIPFPVKDRDEPNLLLDCGANAECQPEWLAQFARMGVVHIRDSYGVKSPRVGLVSIGEEDSKGSGFVKSTFDLLKEPAWQKELGCEFVGNIEGRDLLIDTVDVLVTDGFTGNVMLKTAEGVANTLTKSVGEVLASVDAKIAEPILEALVPLYEKWDPSNTGGAVLLGVKGVCVIAHGSSSPEAMLNAIILAHESVKKDTIEHLKKAIGK